MALITNLVSFWNFDDASGTNVADSLAANAGTFAGVGNSGTQWGTGIVSGGGVFHGGSGATANWVSAGNAAGLQISTGAISAWVKTSDSGSFHGVVIKANAYGIYESGGQFGWFDWGASSSNFFAPTITDNAWHHVVLNFQSGVNSGTTIYVDNVLKGTGKMTVSAQTSALIIGSGLTSSQFLAANIDAVGLWSRVLTTGEISTLYNAGAGLQYGSSTSSTISWSAPGAITYPTALSGTQLNATSTLAGAFVYSPASATVLNAGAGQSLGTTFTPTDTFYGTGTASTTITVNKATPSLSWSTPAPINSGVALSGTQLNATSGGVAGTFSYNPASGTVMSPGVNNDTATFTPTDSTDYVSGGTVSVNITVNAVATGFRTGLQRLAHPLQRLGHKP